MQSETVEQNPFGMEFENVPLDKETLKGEFFVLCFLFLRWRTHFSCFVFCSSPDFRGDQVVCTAQQQINIPVF